MERLLARLRPERAYFWATHQGAELDLLLFYRAKRYGIEIKRADAPVGTRSMKIAMEDLRLDHLSVIHPGAARYRVSKGVAAIPADALAGLSWSTLAG